MRARLGGVLFVALLSGCATQKPEEKPAPPPANPPPPQVVDAGPSGDLSDQTSDKPVELTPAQAAAVEAMRLLTVALDKCRDEKGHALEWDEEHQRGEAIIAGLTASAAPDGGTVAPRPAAEAYVKKVGSALAKHSARSALTWTFRVYPDDDPALEWSIGGELAVSTGALQKAANEAELAAMMAHALAHAASAQTMDDYRVFEEKLCLARALDAAEKGGMTLDLNGVSFKALSSDLLRRYAGKNDAEIIAGLDKTYRVKKTASFAEQDETKNDEAALKMLEAEGYDLNAYVPALDKLYANASWAAAHPMSEGRQSELDIGLAGWRRTHPKPKKPAAIPKAVLPPP